MGSDIWVMDPAPFATTANPDGRNHHEPSRLPSTQPYPQAISDSTGGYRMPELPGWPPTYEKPWPGEGGPDTDITHNEIGKWQPAPHHRSSADADQTDPIGQGDTADGVHQPHSDQTVHEPVDLDRPGVNPERLPTGPIDCIHPGRAGKGSNQTQSTCRAPHAQSACIHTGRAGRGSNQTQSTCRAPHAQSARIHTGRAGRGSNQTQFARKAPHTQSA